jgi:ATP-dependent DNA helicase RecG
VEQRSALISKGEQVDCLVMTATPIPRSLSLTAFGEMELSQIKELPKGREPVETLIFEETKRKSIYNSLRKYINQKRQIYYLFPVIEESEESDLKSLEEGFKILSREVFPEFQISMIHGRMNSQEKTQIMKLFSLGHIQLLVTTTVVEVGIDVPNANVIVIEHPERFGLSQLHQLRGRVGRGKGPAFCVLVLPEGIPSATRERLEEFSKILDGFAIAELDLALRGPGDFLGLRQSGIPPFRVADISRDFGLLEKAKKISQEIIAMDPEMESERFQNLKTFMQTFDWLELATRIN